MNIRPQIIALAAPLDELRDEILNNPNITENERRETIKIMKQSSREAQGIMDPKASTVDDKIKLLTIQKTNWREIANRETAKDTEESIQKALLYNSLANICELKADMLRLESNQRVQSQEALDTLRDVVENSDLTRFQRFKRWAKENLGMLSVVAISVAGVITTIVMGARTAIVKGARATGKFAKALANVAAKGGPVLSAALCLVANVLKLGTKGVMWLSQNLWILAIAMAYFLYDMYKNKKQKK